MPTVVKNNAGKILQEYLKTHGIKQSWVAEKMGITEQNFSNKLKGRRRFTADFALQVSKALGISASIFLSEDYAERVK